MNEDDKKTMHLTLDSVLLPTDNRAVAEALWGLAWTLGQSARISDEIRELTNAKK